MFENLGAFGTVILGSYLLTGMLRMDLVYDSITSAKVGELIVAERVEDELRKNFGPLGIVNVNGLSTVVATTAFPFRIIDWSYLHSFSAKGGLA